MVTNRTSTSITIQWGSISDCSERNGLINQYEISYSSIFHSGSIQFVTSTLMVYTINGLRPQTGYTISVKPENAAGAGPPRAVTDATLLPQGIYNNNYNE